MDKRKPKLRVSVNTRTKAKAKSEPTYEESFFKMLKAAEIYFGDKPIEDNTPEADLVVAYAKYLNNLNKKTIETTGEPL